MINFYNYKNKLVAQYNADQGSAEFYTKRPVVVYINYQKDGEDSVDLTFDFYESTLNDWFPYQIDNQSDNTINTYKKTLTTSGKYRLIIPPTSNEEKVRSNVTFNITDSSANAGTIDVYVFPTSALL